VKNGHYFVPSRRIFSISLLSGGRAARRCGSAALLRGTKDAVMAARYRPKIYL